MLLFQSRNKKVICFQPNAAGLAYENLFHNAWRTNRRLTGSSSYGIRGFKGDYTITVRHRGKVLASSSFSLGDPGVNLQINLRKSEANILIVYLVSCLKIMIDVSILS